MTRSITRLALGIMVSLATASASRADTDVWDNTPVPPGDIRWENGTNWTDGTTPGNGDTATFNLPLSIQVSFVAAPAAIQTLTVSAPVVFQSNGGAKTLSVTSASGGQDVNINAAVLALGTSGNPMHLTVGDDLTVSGGALLNATSGSQVNTLDLFLATVNGGGNGTVVVDGTSSQLNVTNNIGMGLFGNAATLVYQNDAQGTLTGSVTLANSGNSAAAATLSVASSANLTTGSLAVGTGLAAATGTINIHGAGSTLVQSGASTLTVGTAAAGIGALNIGTTATGGTLTTGTGLFTINATGTVTIGSGANTGTLNANGDVLIDGGVLDHNAGTFTLAAGKNLTTRNDGVSSFTGTRAIDGGSTYLIQSGGDFSATNDLRVGSTTAGTLTVDGLNSIASANGAFVGDLGGTANVTFSNGATGSFSAAILVAPSSIAGTTGTVNVQSGADVSLETLHLAIVGGATTTGSFTVDGAGSTVTQTGGIEIVVGSNSTSTGTLTASNAGIFTAVTLTTVRSTGLIQVLSGGEYNTGGNVAVNTGGAGGAGARININGGGSKFTQSGPTTITVGHASVGTGAINIGTTASGGTLTTGTGLFTINPTGTVTIGSATTGGTLNANGNVTINGGVLQLNDFNSTFALAAGKTMTIQNGGRATFSNVFFTANNAVYNISGANSRLQTIAGSPLEISSGGQVNVSAGGLVSSAEFLDIGVSGNGTLSVDGDGSSVVSPAENKWGHGGGVANVTFSNNATGIFNGGISMAGSPTIATTANVNVLSGADLSVGDLFLGLSGGAATTATLNVQGNGSTVTQTGASNLIVGDTTGSGAAIIVGYTASGAIFTTGTGLLTINNYGDVFIGGGDNTGTLNANGNVTINGGALSIGSGSTFNLASGKTMTVQNGGRATFSSQFNAANNAVYNISGANSKLETIAGNRLDINFGGQVNVSSGGLASSAFYLNIGVNGNGTLSVDGNGSSGAADIFSYWGYNGAVANVTFSNNATGSFNGGIEMAGGPTDGTTANVDILSGADLSVGNLFLAASGGETTSATLNVQGNGSTVTQTGASNLIVGHSTTGTARIYIGTTSSGAVFTTGTGLLTINRTAGVVIGNDEEGNTGTLNANGNVLIDGYLAIGNGSTFNLASGKTMTTINGGLVGFSGNYTTAADAIYNIGGGRFQNFGSTIIGNGATVNITFGGLEAFGGKIDIGTVGNGTLSVDGSISYVYAEFDSFWGLNGGTATATFSNNSAGYFPDADIDLAGDSDAGTTAIVSVQSGAELNVHNLSLATAGGATTSATFTVDGAGSTVTQTGAATLTVGHSATGTARLVVKNNGLFTTGTNGVTVRSTGQIDIESGGIFDAYGTINMNGGAFNFLGGTLHADTFNGNLLNQGGTLAPGHSVGNTTIVGSYTQQAGAALEIEIGGLSAGSGHDLLGVTGNAILGGELQLALIGTFVPAAANTFTVLNATGIFGVFSNVTNGQRLTTLDGTGSFLVHYGAGSAFNQNQIILTAFETALLLGDYNNNGTVDAADYVLWRNGGPLANEVDNPGIVNAQDYTEWRLRFGNSSGSGSGATGSARLPSTSSGPEPVEGSSPKSASAVVPEPATTGLALVGLLGAGVSLRARSRNRRTHDERKLREIAKQRDPREIRVEGVEQRFVGRNPRQPTLLGQRHE